MKRCINNMNVVYKYSLTRLSKFHVSVIIYLLRKISTAGVILPVASFIVCFANTCDAMATATHILCDFICFLASVFRSSHQNQFVLLIFFISNLFFFECCFSFIIFLFKCGFSLILLLSIRIFTSFFASLELFCFFYLFLTTAQPCFFPLTFCISLIPFVFRSFFLLFFG